MISNPRHDQDQRYAQTARLADPARYALLRRLALTLRHNLAGALQPLKMMSAMVEKRVHKPTPDIASIARSSCQLHKASAEASRACMGLTTWLVPNAGDMVGVYSDIEDATGVVSPPSCLSKT